METVWKPIYLPNPPPKPLRFATDVAAPHLLSVGRSAPHLGGALQGQRPQRADRGALAAERLCRAAAQVDVLEVCRESRRPWGVAWICEGGLPEFGVTITWQCKASKAMLVGTITFIGNMPLITAELCQSYTAIGK